MNKIFLFLFFIIFSNASILNDFKHHRYKKICKADIINHTANENLLSIIGISCVRSDKIYLLPYIIRKLKNSKHARENAIYLNTIYMQKRLLYSYFFDNFSLKGFCLPNTDYILSLIFNKIKKNEFKKSEKGIIIKTHNKIIKVYPQDSKLFVDEYRKNKLIKRRWYR